MRRITLCVVGGKRVLELFLKTISFIIIILCVRPENGINPFVSLVRITIVVAIIRVNDEEEDLEIGNFKDILRGSGVVEHF